MNVRRAAVGIIALAALSGCGIRPTAVPVDAGAPASRTACPSPVRVPEAADTSATPKPSGSVTPTPGTVPSVTSAPSQVPKSVFSAVPTPSRPSPSPSHCP
ncbi:hypothetical protein GCM10009760_03730 [Kitasatospora kazusensis]|uniref:Uncharacterized protein n=1 Tax=Kitasatospora kazusensis TaxID=407974 RepID=A0ABN2YS17_9ACTN